MSLNANVLGVLFTLLVALASYLYYYHSITFRFPSSCKYFNNSSSKLISNKNASCSIVLILGTRPEVIKLAPLIERLSSLNLTRHCQINILNTGQHVELLNRALVAFPNIHVHHDLNLMQHNQSLPIFIARALPLITNLLTETNAKITIVQGDTASAYCGALASFLLRIPVAHVEAGTLANFYTSKNSLLLRSANI